MADCIAMIPRHDHEGRLTAETWPLPLDEAWLETLFRDLFENHWSGLTFGPMIEGGAYELRAPGPPQKVTVSDGYLTVHWGKGGHFHLCIGETRGPRSRPNPPEVVAHRRPGEVALVRGLDRSGAPVTWSLQAKNGHGESTLAIYFPNPFLTDEDGLADAPDWSRLSLWYHVRSTYAGHAPDGRDTSGKGFGH